jgi:hypothetical protein
MTKLPAAAAAAFLLCLFNTPDARAGCDEYCAEAHEEAYYERAYAREEAAENGYFVDDRRPSRASRQARGTERASTTRAVARAPARREAAEPAEQPTRTSRERTLAVNENSSITTGTTTGATRIADGDSTERHSLAREVGCKSFFPSVGMTLSVPCD